MIGKLRSLFRRPPPPAPVHDSVLGEIRFNGEEKLWEARLGSGAESWRILIAGRAAPDEALLAHARAVAAKPAEFRELVSSFLKREASNFPGGENEVVSLRIESLTLFWPQRPDDGMIYFESDNDDRLWRCDYVKRQPVGLGFDT